MIAFPNPSGEAIRRRMIDAIVEDQFEACGMRFTDFHRAELERMVRSDLESAPIHQLVAEVSALPWSKRKEIFKCAQ